MIKRLERLKHTVNIYIYIAEIRPDRITTCQSERKSVVSQRPSVLEVPLFSQYILHEETCD
jgi:hypothetical protein